MHSYKNNILPDQQRLKESFNKLKETLKKALFDVIVLDFPEKINSND
jgi:predicted GTPase